MNGKIKKEIDVIDLLLNWIEHWKSLVGVVILGVILACGYLFLFTAESPKKNTESVADLANGKFLSELTQEQLAKVSLKDMEKYFLSEKDIVAVDEVIYLQGEYGLKDITIGVPIIVGRKGVEKVIDLDLNKEELDLLKKSAKSVKENEDTLKELGFFK